MKAQRTEDEEENEDEEEPEQLAVRSVRSQAAALRFDSRQLP